MVRSDKLVTEPRARRIMARGALLVSCLALLPAMHDRTANMETRLLDSHNAARAELGLDPLLWDPRLEASAKTWADHLAQTGKFEHSPTTRSGPRQGENLWAGTSGYFTPEEMVKLWVDEKEYFTYGAFPQISMTGRAKDVAHYTQIVWRRTGRVGCAVSDGGREEILVCRYSRPGNIIGRHPY